MKNRKIYVNPDLCTGCNLCASACSVRKWGSCDPKKAAITIRQDLFERFEGQRVCRHCDQPKCVEACMNNCITKDPETGRISHESSKCMGCWMCVMVCPYGAIGMGGENEKGSHVAVFCDLCEDEDNPLCVTVCPTRAIACVTEEHQGQRKKEKSK